MALRFSCMVSPSHIERFLRESTADIVLTRANVIPLVHDIIPGVARYKASFITIGFERTVLTRPRIVFIHDRLFESILFATKCNLRYLMSLPRLTKAAT